MPKNPKNADLDPRECHEFVVLVKKLQCSMNKWMALKYNYQGVGA